MSLPTSAGFCPANAARARLDNDNSKVSLAAKIAKQVTAIIAAPNAAARYLI